MNINKRKLEIALARNEKSVKDIVSGGINRGTYNQIVRKQSGNPETIGKIAKIIGVDVTELIDME